LKTEDISNVNILVMNFSPRKRSNTQILVDEVVKEIEGIKGASAVVYKFAGKNITQCRGVCRSYCEKNDNCVIDDDFNEFSNLWQRADGLIFATPIYALGLPSIYYAVMERWGQTHHPVGEERYSKVGGVIAQGGAPYGGQELAMAKVIFNLMGATCLPISQQFIGEGMAVGYKEGIMEQINADGYFTEQDKANARSLAKRVVEMTMIVQAGLQTLKGILPPEYFFDKERVFSSPKKHVKTD
jgi:multimeric flavodoxin WrbA